MSKVVTIPGGLHHEDFMQQFPHHERFMEEHDDVKPKAWDINKGAAGVPIVAAGGEYVIHPDQVREVGGGDLELGHAVLDDFVKRMRKELIHTLKKLPGPKKD
jgi:hypothetical protein